MESSKPAPNLAYADVAQEMGIDIGNPRQVEDLISAIRYCELKYSPKKMSDDEICNEIGVSINTLARLKGTVYIQAASRIVMSEFANDAARADVRYRMFAVYQQRLVDALENIALIASGQPGRGAKKVASYRDQVSAFIALTENPIAKAYLSNTFLGESVELDEERYLEMRSKLLTKSQVLNLDTDTVIEGESRPVNADQARQPDRADHNQED